MDIETITKFLDAGYTKADIDAMQNTDNAGSEKGEDARKNDAPENEERSNAKTKDAGTVDVNETIKALTDTVAGLTATVKAMQDANVKGAKTDSADGGDNVLNTMKSFIEKL